MQDIIEKARVLIEALPYIQRFRGDTVVVKFGGSVMNDEEAVAAILKDICFMECVGLRPVLVHGGGKRISKALTEKHIEPRFLHGLRVTDADTMQVVEDVLNHVVNPSLVAGIEAGGCKARGLHGDDLIRVEKHTQTDRDTGEPMDWGFVGRIVDIDVEPVRAFQAAHIVPVMTPLGRDEDRRIYNINADEAATAVARALNARKLVFLSNVPGLLRDPEDRSTILSTVHLSEVEELIETGVISGGMLPKIGGAVDAIRAGVQKTHIIDAAMPHSLLLELFTDKGVGTEIVQ